MNVACVADVKRERGRRNCFILGVRVKRGARRGASPNSPSPLSFLTPAPQAVREGMHNEALRTRTYAWEAAQAMMNDGVSAF